MAKTRIPVRGTVGKALRTTNPSVNTGSQAATDATIAALQADVTALQSGTTGGSPSGLTATVWSLIGEIPANISQLAGLTSSGAAFRKSDGTWVIRTFAVGASGLVAVTNSAGAAGNVTYDLASITARSIIANGTNAAAVPTAIQSAGDKSVVRQSGTTVAFNLIDNTFISDFAEAAQDAVGGILTNTATIHFTYNDAGNQITADVQVSATLDVIGSTRGNVLYRGASGWAVLAPGTSGFVLTTAGAGADPSWVAGGGGSGGNVNPDTHPASPNAMDDEFETGSSIDTGKWTWRNQGSATAPVGQGALQLLAPAAAGDNLHIVEQTLPGGAVRFRAKFTVNEVADFAAAGMVLVNSGSGKCMVFGVGHNSNDSMLVYKYTNVTTFSASAVLSTNNATLYGGLYVPRYFEIEYDGTNLKFRVSASGYNGTFVLLFSETAATFLGTPDKIGLFTSPNNASNSLQNTVDWFRRMA